MIKKRKVGIIGATGMVGQRFVQLLSEHPWFEVVTLAASARSAGKTYEEALKGRWKLNVPIPVEVRNIVVQEASLVCEVAKKVDFIFSAVEMPKHEVCALEEAYARTETPVISNNSAHRWTRDVPLLIPEINPEHMKIIPVQKKRLGTQNGFIVVKPNCSIQSYVPLLHVLQPFEPKVAVISTYQSISGAGKTFAEWEEMIDNVNPYIAGEEEKSETEPLKIWGEIANGKIMPSEQLKLTTQCIRVPVTDGHLAAVFVNFGIKPTEEEIITKWQTYQGRPQQLRLPSAPEHFITYFTEQNRPQTKLDRNINQGMGISAGRLRQDKIFDYKFIGLSHNTLRGAAGGSVLIAELLMAEGYIPIKSA